MKALLADFKRVWSGLDARALGAVLLVGACATSCSSDDAGAGINYGGQTGSLVPDCLGGSTDAEIVMSDVAFASSEKLDSVTLKDGNGQAVQFAVEPLADDGAVVIRTDATLTPGRYTLTANCQEFGASQRTLIVGEAAPLPTKLGTLTQQFTDSSCDSQPSLVFTLELDPAAVPYAALLELSVSVDGGEPFLWAPFGSLSAEASSTLSLVLDRCSSAADQ
ncbi:MAG TPA: hypothetical protein VHM70_04520, partial [Polyangiaceae bacterium]|nr:hypothetical protein [Polyangiaceae bacterium]